MESIEDVYHLLKVFDTENKLTLFGGKIELSVNNNDKIIAFEEYVSIVLKGKEITHFHPDYDEMHQYLLDIMEKRERLPTKKEIYRKQTKSALIIILSSMLAVIFCEMTGLRSLFLRILIIIIFVILAFLLIWLVNKILIIKRNGHER